MDKKKKEKKNINLLKKEFDEFKLHNNHHKNLYLETHSMDSSSEKRSPDTSTDISVLTKYQLKTY